MASGELSLAQCKVCEEEFSDKRKALGYNTCLDCGGRIANKQAALKSKQVAPAFNKGAYQYITSMNMAKDIGR